VLSPEYVSPIPPNMFSQCEGCTEGCFRRACGNPNRRRYVKMKKKYVYGILIAIVVATIYVVINYSGILKEEEQ
jgi:hypothetical protein